MALPSELMLIMSSEYLIHARRAQLQTYDLMEEDLADLNEEELEEEMYLTGQTAIEMSKLSSDALMIWTHTRHASPHAQRRRGPYNQIQKCEEYFEKALGWPEREFRHEFRLSRNTFDQLVSQLEKNTAIFQSKGRKPQKAVRYQLATFLMRYGSRGSDAMSAAKRMGIGLGTVWLYCRRVTRALREIGVEVISWGDDARRAETAEEIRKISGLKNCIGIIDGSLIRLTDIPAEWGTVYFCRKKFPSVNVQAICDHQKRFISFDMGWPGSMTDVTILKNSYLWKNRRSYFSGDQYLLADRGYPSSPYLLRPYTEPEVNAFQGHERTRRLQFNKTLSGVRVWIEHAFGMLKGRFLSLKDFGRHDNVQEVYKVIQALMVLHNLCIDWDDPAQKFLDEGRLIFPNDEVDDQADVDVTGYGGVDISVEDEARVPTYETDDWHREEGHRMRDTILNNLLP